jgi:hypothetical protein
MMMIRQSQHLQHHHREVPEIYRSKREVEKDMATAHRPHSTISIIHSTISIINNGYYKQTTRQLKTAQSLHAESSSLSLKHAV